MRILTLLFMVYVALVNQSALAQSPDAVLSKLPPDMREWVNRSCPRSLGPSLWSSCIVRETSAASRGKPDLSHLKPDLQAWVIRSCPNSLGPSLAISCLNRESNALTTARLDISFLTEEQKEWVSRSCPTSLGPSLCISCIQRESAVLRGTQSVPQQPRVDASRVPRLRHAVSGRASSAIAMKLKWHIMMSYSS